MSSANPPETSRNNVFEADDDGTGDDLRFWDIGIAMARRLHQLKESRSHSWGGRAGLGKIRNRGGRRVFVVTWGHFSTCTQALP